MAILIFGLLIFVHELGHFLAARAFNVEVTEFAIGMGPAIFKRQRGETLYTIRIIPFGGFCKMRGMGEETKTAEIEKIDGDDSEIVDFSRSFDKKPWYAKFTILAAGSFMNLVLGFVICIIMVVVLINMSAVSAMGVTIPQTMNVFEIIQTAWALTIVAVELVVGAIRLLITGGAGIPDLSGPVEMVNIMVQAAERGIIHILWLTAFISVNLGIFNLLPLPALDGGRIIFVIIEAIRRKPIPAEKEAIIHFVGIVLLLGLMIFITFNDIVSCVTG